MRILLCLAFLLGLACGGTDPDESSSSLEPGDSTGSEVDESGTDETSETDDPAASEGTLVVGEDACETDEDCVPAACCHAAACVGRANAPSCEDAMCTMDCQYGTLDCGGGCLCHEGRCAARLSERPQLEVDGQPIEAPQ